MNSGPTMVIAPACGEEFYGGLATSAGRRICPIYVPVVGSA
jgi:hypothetical protein